MIDVLSSFIFCYNLFKIEMSESMRFKWLLSFLISILSIVNVYSQNPLYQIGSLDSVYSKTYETYKRFWVELPEQYDPQSSKKYPVVFVLDGSIQMDALSTVYNYYWGHYLPEMILVGISNQENRTRDLTPTKIEERYGMPFHEESGGANDYLSFIERELIPYIDKHYSTTSYRTLIGHSYAGLFTVNTLLEAPHLFTNYIAIDPGLDWDNQNMLNRSKQKLLDESYSKKSLFITLAGEQLHMLKGSLELNEVKEDTSSYTLFARSILELVEFMETKNKALNFDWKYYPNDLHATVVLPSIQDGLKSLFKWYELEDPSVFNNLETPVKELVDVMNDRAKKLTEHFGYQTPPMVEDQINMLGYMALSSGQIEKAKFFFDLNIQYYPESANVYDSMADYYEAQKDYKEALSYVKRAFKITPKPYYKGRISELSEKL